AASSPWRIAIIPFAGGDPVRYFAPPANVGLSGQPLRWLPDGTALSYIANVNGISNIWSQPLTDATPQMLTQFNEGQIFSFAWSPNGTQLACVRGFLIRDLILRQDSL